VTPVTPAGTFFFDAPSVLDSSPDFVELVEAGAGDGLGVAACWTLEIRVEAWAIKVSRSVSAGAEVDEVFVDVSVVDSSSASAVAAATEVAGIFVAEAFVAFGACTAAWTIIALKREPAGSAAGMLLAGAFVDEVVAAAPRTDDFCFEEEEESVVDVLSSDEAVDDFEEVPEVLTALAPVRSLRKFLPAAAKHRRNSEVFRRR